MNPRHRSLIGSSPLHTENKDDELLSLPISSLSGFLVSFQAVVDSGLPTGSRSRRRWTQTPKTGRTSPPCSSLTPHPDQGMRSLVPGSLVPDTYVRVRPAVGAQNVSDKLEPDAPSQTLAQSTFNTTALIRGKWGRYPPPPTTPPNKCSVCKL